MSPESQEEIHFPVAPVRQQGIVKIEFEISSQAGRKSLVHSVEVLVSFPTESKIDLLNCRPQKIIFC